MAEKVLRRRKKIEPNRYILSQECIQEYNGILVSVDEVTQNIDYLRINQCLFFKVLISVNSLVIFTFLVMTSFLK